MLLSKQSIVRYNFPSESAGVPDGFGSTILCPEQTKKQFACGFDIAFFIPVYFSIARFGNPCATKVERSKNVLSSFAMLYFLPKTEGFPSGNRKMDGICFTKTAGVC
jgi:hypothetical protein